MQPDNYWKGRNICLSPKIANKRIARSNSQSYRKLALARMAMVQVMKTRTESTKLMSTMCYVSEKLEPLENKSQGISTWDTDSFEVKVDSGCSVSLSGDLSDFVPGTLKATKGNVSIQSYGGGRTAVTHSGTILWKIRDDTNCEREIKLPGALYVPGCKTKLLSPQHLAQVTDLPETPLNLKTKATAYGDCMILQWTAAQYKKTIRLDKCNLGTMYTLPGYTKFAAYCNKVNILECSEQVVKNGCFEATKITENGQVSDEFKVSATTDKINSNEWNKNDMLDLSNKLRQEGLIDDVDKNIFKDTNQTAEVMNKTYKNVKQDKELMMIIHQQLCHIPFKRIIRMAENGTLPRRLAKCPIPICQSCIYGKLTRKAWRTKGETNLKKLKIATPAGEVISVDQLE
jgi:hypothetical protein